MAERPTNADVLARCRVLAEQTIPELRGVTFHVLDSDVLRNDPRLTRDGLLGWAAQATDVSQVLSKYLGSDWEPGPAIFLNLRWLRERSFKGQFERSAQMVFVHELGHLEFPLWQPASFTTQVAETVGRLQLAALTYSFGATNATAPNEDEMHDWRWIRRVIHIYVRASYFGYAFGIDRLLHSGDCRFDAKKYVPILLAEALRMRDEPIEAINALPPDEWLVGTYEDDVEDFVSEIASPEESADVRE